MPEDVPITTMLGVHLNANEHGYMLYNAMLVYTDRKKLRSVKLWLPVELVRTARSRSSEERDAARRAIMLNVTNAYFWNPLPRGEALRWSQLRLTQIKPPSIG